MKYTQHTSWKPQNDQFPIVQKGVHNNNSFFLTFIITTSFHNNLFEITPRAFQMCHRHPSMPLSASIYYHLRTFIYIHSSKNVFKRRTKTTSIDASSCTPPEQLFSTLIERKQCLHCGYFGTIMTTK